MQDQLRQAWRQLTADKKKLGLMVGLMAVGLLLWGRLMLKQVPQVATADDGLAVAAAAADAARHPRPRDGGAVEPWPAGP